MELTAKQKHSSTYDHESIPWNDATLFTMEIGPKPMEMNKLGFKCVGRTRGRMSGELEFCLTQCFPHQHEVLQRYSYSYNRRVLCKKEPNRIFSCHWSLKVRAVIRRNDETIFDSSGENEGVIREAWNTTCKDRKIHSINLGGRDDGFMNDIENRHPDETLTLTAEVEIVAKIQKQEDIGVLNQITSSNLSCIKQQPSAAGLGLIALLRKDDSGVTIRCDSVDMKAHKVVLKCYSPVFARMFDNPMDESVTSVIKIDDFEPGTIEDMISFLYEGTVNASSKDSVVALLDCAEKYDISELKVAVIKKMLANIAPDNAALFAAALTTYRADEGSKNAIFDYVKANFPQLSTNSHFRQFFKENVQYLL